MPEVQVSARHATNTAKRCEGHAIEATVTVSAQRKDSDDRTAMAFLLRGCVALQKRRAERCRHPCSPKAAGEKVEVISVPYTATFLLEHGLHALSRAPGNH